MINQSAKREESKKKEPSDDIKDKEFKMDKRHLAKKGILRQVQQEHGDGPMEVLYESQKKELVET